MKITTVRISDDQHEWVAQNRPQQLSRIVRNAIDELRFAETAVAYHNSWRDQAQICYPFPRGGYCGLCWPHGPPDRIDWQAYMHDTIHGEHRGTWAEWNRYRFSRKEKLIQESAQLTLTNYPTQQEGREASNDDGKGVLVRIWRFFF